MRSCTCRPCSAADCISHLDYDSGTALTAGAAPGHLLPDVQLSWLKVHEPEAHAASTQAHLGAGLQVSATTDLLKEPGLDQGPPADHDSCAATLLQMPAPLLAL